MGVLPIVGEVNGLGRRGGGGGGGLEGTQPVAREGEGVGVEEAGQGGGCGWEEEEESVFSGWVSG